MDVSGFSKEEPEEITAAADSTVANLLPEKSISFLKKNSAGCSAKKSKIITREQIQAYLSETDDNDHLMRKVALIFGISGACRTDELINLSVDNIDNYSPRYQE
ncbi:hypothetical protein Zmor_018366 [Zophobas morio]|uniref:Uncharacterized protein n=1 Tax=Zophobas morio TaxID=2755281 RepID=A0AA38IA94_9CUCU|nr:hypothetical protein Zmor_018366 [Zophobas morio]